MVSQFTTCLMFHSGCEPALAFYEQMGLGRAVEVRRFGDPGASPIKPGYAGTISMARFEGPQAHFLACDTPDAEPMRGFCLVLLTDTPDAATEMFGRLAEGGVIATPVGIQPWGDFYGKLTDRFGVQWAVNCRAISQA